MILFLWFSNTVGMNEMTWLYKNLKFCQWRSFFALKPHEVHKIKSTKNTWINFWFLKVIYISLQLKIHTKKPYWFLATSSFGHKIQALLSLYVWSSCRSKPYSCIPDTNRIRQYVWHQRLKERVTIISLFISFPACVTPINS